MGIYRLILSYMVLFGHIYEPFAEYFSIGVSAVVSFFLLSGFVMTALTRKYYFQISSIPAFYADRLLRLAPQFYFYSVVTLFAMIQFGLRHDFMQVEPTIKSIILQFGLVPLNFYRYFPSMLIPQAWSLGLEVIFYLVFPFLILKKLLFHAAITSFCVYLTAYTGIIDGELWGYRYLPGTLFIFISGSFLYFAEKKREIIFIYFILVGVSILLWLAFRHAEFDSVYSRSVLIGLLFGIPVVASLKPLSHEPSKEGSIDNLAGNLSYGVFLNHMLIIGCLKTFFSIETSGVGAVGGAGIIIVVLVVSTGLSYVSFNFVEKPLIEVRKMRHERNLDRYVRISEY